ncbi:hypothetical protein AVEN_117472-1 [Araneus ventricosus]|uniref:Speckle-type POZ protein n=1 Tax=Araneus ventricosus TaxID=182803 RepID=A0A4Y2HTX8_ARAVE|nr:hypothetical protein AVEN_117472-1 [Araneus ventricosus]
METVKTDRKSFTFTWKIKNFSFCWHGNYEDICSPTFQVHTKDITSWRLELSPFTVNNYIVCCLWKVKDVPSSFSVGYELSFLTQNESTLNSVEVSAAAFKEELYSVPLRVHRDVVFGEERASLLPNDTLTIQCKIWEVEGSILETERCFAETEIEVQHNSSIFTIERFSSLKQGEKSTQTSSRTSTTKQYFIFSMYLEDRVNMNIEINPVDTKAIKLCKCQMFLLDAAGKRLKCGRYEFLPNAEETNPPWVFALSFIRRNLTENKRQYLPNDVLTLQYEIEFSTGRQTGKILKPDSHQNLQKVTHNVATDNFPCSVEKYSASSLSWKDDLLSMYIDSLFCDIKLKTSAEFFPVHSLILRIRSPVFNDMMTAYDCESLKEYVYIEDLDANTVRKMILFLYTDTLDDLDWESAKNLYSAANKYEITSLKHLCSSFLKENLEPTNCCDILYMADRYQDHSLISAVQSFISKYDKEILVSEVWRNLEEKNSLLACKTLRKLYVEKLAEIISLGLL